MNALLIGSVFLFVFSGIAFPDDSDNLLSQYLKSKNLDRLSLRLLETNYASELNPDRQNELVLKLADHYRDLLLNWSPNSASDSIIQRAESLIADHPALISEDLRIAIVHARYSQTESKFLEWWEQSAPGNERNALLQSLASVQKLLQRVIDFNELQRDDTLANIPLDEVESKIRQMKLDQLEARISHANYLMGWTSYFQALTSFEIDSDQLKRAAKSFLRALRIEQTLQVGNIDPKWLDLSSSTSHRALVGLGLVYSAQANRELAEFCFQMAHRISPDLVTDVIRLNSFAFSRDWQSAFEFADGKARSSGELKDSEFWNTVLNAGLVATSNGRSVAANIDGTKLQRLGLLGLMREFDGDSIAKFIQRSKIELNENNSQDLWIKSLLTFQDFRRNSQKLIVAKSQIETAISLISDDFNGVDLIRMNYLKGLIEFQQGQFSNALKTLPKNPIDIAAENSRLAEKISWLRCQCLIQLCQNDPRKAPLALATMNQLLSTFPFSKLKSKIEFSKFVVTNQLLSPELAIEKLKQIPSSHPYFVEAQLEVIKHQFRIWQATGSADSNVRSETFNKLVQLYEAFQQQNKDKHASCLQSLYFVIGASISMESDPETIDAKIAVANQLAKLNDDDFAVHKPRLIQYQFLVDKMAGRIESATDNAKWLFENSGDKRSEIAALSFLAENSSQLPINEKVSIYESLLERLGNSNSDLVNSTNARVAANRLVTIYIELKQWQKAESLNQKLLQANLNQQQIVYNAARIANQLGKTEQANKYWLKLAGGTIDGSELWLEAKYELVKLLRDTNLQRATKLLIQTRALAGQMPNHWQQKFNDLEIGLKALDTKSPPH